MITFVDLVCVATATGGTSAFQLGAAVDGYRGQEALLDGGLYRYSVQQGANYEVGVGTYVASTQSLSRTPIWSSHGNVAVDFASGAQVNFTFAAEDIADLAALAGSVSATAKAAFNAYGLLWALWFNGTPDASELLALYSAAIDFQIPANFAGSATAAPTTSPADTWLSTIDMQAGGTGPWTTVGTITISTDGTVSLATTDAAPITVAKGDRLRWLAPATPDLTVRGFSATVKGVIP